MFEDCIYIQYKCRGTYGACSATVSVHDETLPAAAPERALPDDDP